MTGLEPITSPNSIQGQIRTDNSGALPIELHKHFLKFLSKPWLLGSINPVSLIYFRVPLVGLEPTLLAEPDFESGVSAIPPQRRTTLLREFETCSLTGVEPARRSYLHQHGDWRVSRFTTANTFRFPLPQVSLHPRVYFLRWDSIPTIRSRHFTREACISSTTKKY